MYDAEGLSLEVIRNHDAWARDEHVLYDWLIKINGIVFGRITVTSTTDRPANPAEVRFYINSDAGAVYGIGKSCKALDNQSKSIATYESDNMIYYHDDRYTDIVRVDDFITSTFEHFHDDYKQAGYDTDEIKQNNWQEMFTDLGFDIIDFPYPTKVPLSKTSHVGS